MTRLKLLLAFVFVDFAAMNAYVVYTMGYDGFVRAVLDNPATITAMVDLVIALSLILAWMVRDARRRGARVLPYLPLTLAFGSVGPLLYLLKRPQDEPAA
jgi:hypothetical protein